MLNHMETYDCKSALSRVGYCPMNGGVLWKERVGGKDFLRSVAVNFLLHLPSVSELDLCSPM